MYLEYVFLVEETTWTEAQSGMQWWEKQQGCLGAWGSSGEGSDGAMEVDGASIIQGPCFMLRNVHFILND